MSVKVAKKPASTDNIVDIRRQQVDTLQMQCQAVQRMLGIATHQHRRIEVEYADVIRQIAETEQLNEETLTLLGENVKTMKNLSKLTKEQLKHRLESVQKGVADSKHENNALRSKMQELKEEKERELKEWSDAVDMQQQLIEEKALVFGMQLKNALEELAKYDGRDNRPIYISVKGKVYDCSSARQFYGPGSPYEVFAGKEATRCLAKMIIGADEANAGWGNLSDENLSTLNDWIEKYEAKYPVVGHFVPDPDFITRGDAFEP